MSISPIRPNAEALSKALRGYTDLRGFHLAVEAKTSHYSLRLTLANSAGKELVLLFTDVQNLELNPTGEGFEQLPSLRIEDVREEGLERIHYTVDELQAEALFFHCAAIELVS